MTGTRPTWLTDRSLVKNLGPAVGVVWAVSLVLGYTIGVTASGDINETVQLVLEGCIFTFLVVRLIAASRVWPERGLALIALTVGVVLWAAGSIVLNAGESQTAVTFPAPGEWFFLASYIGMAAFIVLDATIARGRRCLPGWTPPSSVALRPRSPASCCSRPSPGTSPKAAFRSWSPCSTR